VVAPGAALLAYGSALGAGVCGAWVCPANTTIPTAAHRIDAINKFLTVPSVSCDAFAGRICTFARV
jgi:hypothetical protein